MGGDIGALLLGDAGVGVVASGDVGIFPGGGVLQCFHPSLGGVLGCLPYGEVGLLLSGVDGLLDGDGGVLLNAGVNGVLPDGGIMILSRVREVKTSGLLLFGDMDVVPCSG